MCVVWVLLLLPLPFFFSSCSDDFGIDLCRAIGWQSNPSTSGE